MYNKIQTIHGHEKATHKMSEVKKAIIPDGLKGGGSLGGCGGLGGGCEGGSDGGGDEGGEPGGGGASGGGGDGGGVWTIMTAPSFTASVHRPRSSSSSSLRPLNGSPSTASMHHGCTR
jgi:hypothetical protein